MDLEEPAANDLFRIISNPVCRCSGPASCPRKSMIHTTRDGKIRLVGLDKRVYQLRKG